MIVKHNEIAGAEWQPEAPSRTEYEEGLRRIRALNLPNVRV